MTIKELQEIVNRLVQDGQGEHDVVFDTEARTFHVHYVEIDDATFEDVKDSGLRPLLIFTTRYH